MIPTRSDISSEIPFLSPNDSLEQRSESISFSVSAGEGLNKMQRLPEMADLYHGFISQITFLESEILKARANKTGNFGKSFQFLPGVLLPSYNQI